MAHPPYRWFYALQSGPSSQDSYFLVGPVYFRFGILRPNQRAMAHDPLENHHEEYATSSIL